MDNTQQKHDQNNIFALTFILAQRWQTQGDRLLHAHGLTTKQWLLLATIGSLQDSAPTLGQITAAFGTSRQNVKQIALNLQKRGFLTIQQDPVDKRILRFRITPESDAFWYDRAGEDDEFISGLFQGVPAADLHVTARVIQKLVALTEETEKQKQEEEK